MARELDSVDRGVLYMLQVDARNTTSQEIADKLGVSASTVRNRIDRLEEDGIVTGYHVELDYERANLPFRVVFVITADPSEREDVVDSLMDVRGVVDVRELLTARRNVQAEVVGRTSDDVVRVTDAIHDLGVEVESSEIVRQRRTQPFNHFYFSKDADDDDRLDPENLGE
ncbi:Lrp/AsnC family transcriptional regulator [Halobaculum sp. EA56]|uniref:Lrp/AsnC family transcriptional regulator n=1 Tax=Halobaculum sp. EA56 TaxID=3421648 RepID=UPI003EBE795E